MRKASYLAGAAGLAIAAAGLFAPAAAASSGTGSPAPVQQVSVTAGTSDTGCSGSTFTRVPRNGDVWGWLWYTQSSGGACIGTVDEVFYNPAPAYKTVSLHIGPYVYTQGPFYWAAGNDTAVWSVHQFYHRTNFDVCLGVENTPGYACVTIP